LDLVNNLVLKYKEVRVFNTICDATFENQAATKDLAKKVDIMIVIGGKNSSNTKQLLTIAQDYCKNSYLIEDEKELNLNWFKDKKLCGVTAGASTPDWIIQIVIQNIQKI
jgi:4-hydroxy-3-methylbut-2-enyl diphosphate reductase